MIVDKYEVRCVGPPDEKGRVNCLGCRREAPCYEPGCGVGVIHVYSGASTFSRESRNKKQKNRRYKRLRMEAIVDGSSVGP